ncbi:phage tail protein [Serratia sp. (in: enterobacteria)]|uniref:phage tail-collar fiber domain-containing protein n=1 Tax=Serratia sp. (in: enterobacteria) TaxID=616 RepID=UPI003988DDB6
MSARYFALLTNIGVAKITNAAALGIKLNITEMAVGDGGGSLPTPTPDQTSLVNERRRAPINQLSIDPLNDAQIIVEQVIPENIGGWWIKEVGLYDEDGDLVAVSNCPETYKPLLQEGSGRTQTVRMVIIVSNTSSVTVKIDPAIVLATRKYVDDASAAAKKYASDTTTNAMNQHVAEENPHTQYPLIAGGLSELKTAGESVQASAVRNIGLTHLQGAVSIVFDDGTDVSKNVLIPLAVTHKFKAALALFVYGMGSSYNRVRMEDAHQFIKDTGGEVLSHSSNGLVLNSDVPQSYGESLIRAGKSALVQMGFNIAGFVAPDSVFDSKFYNELRVQHDYAFTRSVTKTQPTLSVNRLTDDVYNMKRVSIEAITLEHAKSLVDYAISTNTYLCFYTHLDPGWLADLMIYIKSKEIAVVTPTEWVARYKPITTALQHSGGENLLINSRFDKISDSHQAPYKWSVDTSAFNNASITFSPGESGNTLDINGGAGTLAGAKATLSQNYFIKPTKIYTPFCFWLRPSSLQLTNAQIRLSIYAKSGATDITSNSRTFTLRENDQLAYVELGVIPSSTIDRILVEINVIAIADGAVRAIIKEPALDRIGKPGRYIPRGIDDKYYSVMRRKVAQNIAPNVDTDLIFEDSLEGTNYIYDPVTGIFSASDGRCYDLVPFIGLNGMAAGEIITMKFWADTVNIGQVTHVCTAGLNLMYGPLFKVRADGRAYKITLSHNATSDRALTTFQQARLMIESPGVVR